MVKLVVVVSIVFVCTGCTAIVPLTAGLMFTAQGISHYQYTTRRDNQLKGFNPYVSVEFMCVANNKSVQSTGTRHVKGFKPYIYEDIYKYCAKKQYTVEILSESTSVK